MPMKKLILKDVHVHSRYLSKFINDLNKTKLECLVLKNCDGINDKVLLEMSRLNFPKLKRFFVYINDTNMASVPNCINLQLENWPFLRSTTIISKKRLMSHLESLKLTTKFNCNVFITDYDCKFNSLNSQRIVEEYFEFAYKFNLNHLHNKFFQMKKEYDHWCEQNVDWNWLRSNKRMQYVWNLNYFVKLGSKSWLRVLFCQFSVNWLKRISQNCPNCPFMTFWQNFREINSLHALTFLAATCEAISRKKNSI